MRTCAWQMRCVGRVGVLHVLNKLSGFASVCVWCAVLCLATMPCRHCRDGSCSFCIKFGELFSDSEDDVASDAATRANAVCASATSAAASASSAAANTTAAAGDAAAGIGPTPLPPSTPVSIDPTPLPQLGVSRSDLKRTTALLFGNRVAPYLGIVRTKAAPPVKAAPAAPRAVPMLLATKDRLMQAKVIECQHDLSEVRRERILWEKFDVTSSVDDIASRCMNIASMPFASKVKIGVTLCPMWRMYHCHCHGSMVPHHHDWHPMYVLAVEYGSTAAGLEAALIDRVRNSPHRMMVSNVNDGGDGPIRPHKPYFVYCLSDRP